jgi:hypothetical protein
VQVKRPQIFYSNQWLARERAELFSAYWAFAEIVPKRIERTRFELSL